jgi:hypothetical protein
MLWAGLVVPALALGLALLLNGSLGARPSNLYPVACLGTGMLGFLGLAAAAAGLFMAKPLERRKAALPAILGILLALGAMGASGYGVAAGVQRMAKNRQNLAEVDRTLKSYQAQIKQSIGKSNEMEIRMQALEGLRAMMEKGSKEADPSGAKAMEASAAMLGRLQVPAKVYEAKLKVLLAAQVLNGATLTSKAQFAPRREVVEDFRQANQELVAAYTNMEASFRAELAARQLPERIIQAQLAGFRKSLAARNALVLKIRQKDEELGQQMLRVLDLLEDQWGRWSYDKETTQILFTADSAADQYNQSVRRIEQIGTEQQALQRLAAEVR